jgi:hypothetical protein
MSNRRHDAVGAPIPDLAPSAIPEDEAARYLSMSRSYLRQSRCYGDRPGRTRAPPWLKIGRCIRYRVSDLDSWLEKFRQGGQS